MPYSARTTKLHRIRKQRRALLKILAANLILWKRIRTTEAKAKSVRPFIERLITVARKGTLASRRHIGKYLSLKAADLLARDIAPRYAGRPGGYTRVIKIGTRKGDAARMAYLELVE